MLRTLPPRSIRMAHARRIFALLGALLLGACAQGHELTTPRGSVFGLNAGHWTPSPEDLAPPRSSAP